MKNIITVIKKDFRRFFTDKRMLINLLLPGLMIFIIYSLMGSFMFKEKEPDDHTYKIVTVNEIKNENDVFFLRDFFGDLNIEFTDFNSLNTTHEAMLKNIEEGNYDLYVTYTLDFYNEAINFVPNNGNLNIPVVNIFYNSTNDYSNSLNVLYLNAVSAFQSSISEKFKINQTNEQLDLATKSSIGLEVISTLVPFLLLIFLFSGSMAISIEAIAGEKERGTIATILATPIKRNELALGKIISLSLVSLVSAASSFIGLMLSIPKLMGGLEIDFNGLYSFLDFALLFLLILTTTLLYTAIVSLLSAFSKSVKEASGFASVLMILNMVVGVTSMSGSASSNTLLYLIPFYNSVSSFTQILSQNISSINLLVTIISNLALVILSTYILSKMFENEKIMFNK